MTYQIKIPLPKRLLLHLKDNAEGIYYGALKSPLMFDLGSVDKPLTTSELTTVMTTVQEALAKMPLEVTSTSAGHLTFEPRDALRTLQWQVNEALANKGLSVKINGFPEQSISIFKKDPTKIKLLQALRGIQSLTEEDLTPNCVHVIDDSDYSVYSFDSADKKEGRLPKLSEVDVYRCSCEMTLDVMQTIFDKMLSHLKSNGDIKATFSGSGDKLLSAIRWFHAATFHHGFDLNTLLEETSDTTLHNLMAWCFTPYISQSKGEIQFDANKAWNDAWTPEVLALVEPKADSEITLETTTRLGTEG